MNCPVESVITKVLKRDRAILSKYNKCPLPKKTVCIPFGTLKAKMGPNARANAKGRARARVRSTLGLGLGV